MANRDTTVTSPHPKLVPMRQRKAECLTKNHRQLGRAQYFKAASGLLRQCVVVPVSEMPAQIIHRKRNIKLISRCHRSQANRKSANLRDKRLRTSLRGNAALKLLCQEREKLIV